MIYNFFLVILILASIVLVLAILAQAGKGGGLAANFGGAGSSSDSLLGSRQASNLLTKSSWTAGGVFLALSFILSLASVRPSGPPDSVLNGLVKEQAAQQPASALPAGGSPLNLSAPVKSDSGSAKAATKAADSGKAGSTKAPAKVPPQLN